MIHLLDAQSDFHRKLLLWVHVLTAAAVALVYLNRANLTFAFWGSANGVAIVLILAPILFPYLVSAVYCWKIVTEIRWRVLLFIVMLIGSSVLVGLAIGGAFGPLEHLVLVEILLVQSAGYLWIAELLLHVV